MKLDISRIGDWADLPFFSNDLPQIEAKLAAEDRTVFPPAQKVFAALERTQPEQVKVVIFGQDPYPQAGKANGLAFSILEDFPPRKRQDSLHNIFNELQDDLNTTRSKTNLEDWADQGVLLFNCLGLTVPEGKAGGHRALGWKKLTQDILDRLAGTPRAYLMWGGDAHKAIAGRPLEGSFLLKSSHPSPLGVHKAGADFVPFHHSKPFSRTDAWLQAHDMQPINWGDPET